MRSVEIKCSKKSIEYLCHLLQNTTKVEDIEYKIFFYFNLWSCFILFSSIERIERASSSLILN